MRVSVETGCRLHLGFTNLSEDVGRRFGSIGVAIDRPTTTVVLEEHDTLEVVARRPERICTLVDRFCEHYGVQPGVAIEVRESIPEHVGLGSGTQLALVVGLGLAKVSGVEAGVREMATVMGRGDRSGVGTSTFEHGGLVIDAGHRSDLVGCSVPPTVVWRHEVPADWRFVVAIPDAIRGLSGRREEAAFETLAPSVHTSEEICRVTQLRLMPAVVEQDIEAFGAAVTAIDEKTGAYFTSAQGGVYNGKQGGHAVASMLAAGALGAGQSSWGPAVYGVTQEGEAAAVAARVQAHMQERGVGCRVFVGRGRNQGAGVDVVREVPVRARPESVAVAPWPCHTTSEAPPCSRPGSSL
jgi:beta-ribofuranosylaminobenzene 5'-phosphate synthase